MPIFLTRDLKPNCHARGNTPETWYRLHFDEKPKPLKDQGLGADQWHGDTGMIEPDVFHEQVNGIRLEPGEGPVEVDIAIRPSRRHRPDME